VIISDAIAHTFAERSNPGVSPIPGHPLACAAAVASIGIFQRDQIVEHAHMLGVDVIGPAARRTGRNVIQRGETRGIGCFWAVETGEDPVTREPLVPFNAGGATNAPMNAVAAAARQHGVCR